MFATFIENNRDALASLRDNICACKAEAVSRIIGADALHPPIGTPHQLVFLDPPYAQHLIPQALAALSKANYLSPDAVLVAETGPDDDFMPKDPLAVRQHGKARILFWRGI